MRLDRLGAFHQTRLSFVRSLTRKMAREEWTIECTRFDLDADGFGDTLFSITTPGKEGGKAERYTLVFFTQHLDDTDRSDRVIAEAWDLAFALCEGEVTESMLAELRENIPKQEAGRCSAKVLVLSRANKSVRNFNHIVEKLARGQQPDPERLAKVGYLYRTTAVYGNGKFGLADFARLRESSAFEAPFSAQMFVVYMLKHFSIMQVNHLAKECNPDSAVQLEDDIARYLGTGNATGLGMAPFLVNHPLLINQWIAMRERALARVLYTTRATEGHVKRFLDLVQRSQRHVGEIFTDDPRQAQRNCQLHGELGELDVWFRNFSASIQFSTRHVQNSLWKRVTEKAAEVWSLETAELINSILLELYPELVDDLESQMGVDEAYDLIPQMPLRDLQALIESCYDWVLCMDFSTAESQHFFWYRSAEKEEPRRGLRYSEPGSEKEIRVDVARIIHFCYQDIGKYAAQTPNAKVTDFLIHYPEYRAIVARVQTLSHSEYGDIRENLIGQTCIPIDLLRCKLSFFGCSKFDPKSALWLRITLFQGAPLLHELCSPELDDWFLPVAPPPHK